MLSHSTEIEKLPPTLYNADIALNLKPDRDDTNPASYRPISMLNMDFKIFTKILANRLNHCIESLIHRDQTGFIPNRYSFFKTRWLIKIMYYKCAKGSKQAILCLDAKDFLYLFQNIPIFIPMSFFKMIDSVILPFVWGYKVHRISKQHLQKPKNLKA